MDDKFDLTDLLFQTIIEEQRKDYHLVICLLKIATVEKKNAKRTLYSTYRSQYFVKSFSQRQLTVLELRVLEFKYTVEISFALFSRR